MMHITATAATTRRRHPARLRACRGQALAEFLAIALAMVPLFLLLPMIGKYQDLAHVTQMASRYAAFDATSFGDEPGFNDWKPPAQLAAEVQRRFYSNADAPIKTGDVAGEFDAHRNLFWRDPFGNALLASFNSVDVSFGNNSATQANGFSTGSGADSAPFNAMPFSNATAVGLQARGLYSANVGVAIANLPSGIKSIAPFDALDLTIRRHTSLLFDPWHSPTTVRTEQRVATLAPVGTNLAPVSTALAVAIELLDRGAVAPPVFADLSEWRDEVPADRIRPVQQ